MKIVILPMKALVLLAVLLGSPPASAQGTRAGYEREARFLTDDLGRSVQPADIRPICVQGLTTSGIGNPGGTLNSNW